MATLSAARGGGRATAALAAEDLTTGAGLLGHRGSLVGAVRRLVLFSKLVKYGTAFDLIVRTYSCTDTVGLVGAVLNGVVALRDSVVKIGAANHCEGCRK